VGIRALQPSRSPGLAFHRIVVPLVAGDESEAAMALAAELAADRGACITAVAVIEVEPELPLEAHMLDEEARAKRVLEEAHAIGGSHGVAVRARTLRARQAGEAIVGEADRVRADLIVLRAPRKQRVGRRARVFGRTVDYVLKHAGCRVMVAGAPPA
jgi:nucleotide-binding universal stress UspA family protein